jgi:hypothetical protein
MLADCSSGTTGKWVDPLPEVTTVTLAKELIVRNHLKWPNVILPPTHVTLAEEIIDEAAYIDGDRL